MTWTNQSLVGSGGVVSNGGNTFGGVNAGGSTATTGIGITGATNANPIVITTSGPHGLLSTSGTLTVTGVGGNTAANGTFTTYTTPAPNTISLTGIAGNGNYTSGGTLSCPAFASNDTGVGKGALALTTTGHDETAYGVNALASGTTSYSNTAIGVDALATTQTSYENVAVGNEALSRLTTGHSNTACGLTALQTLTTGSFNTACGVDALAGIVGIPLTGSSNTAVGGSALATSQGVAANNTSVGASSLQNLTTGINNTAIGGNAGGDPTNGVVTASTCLFVGYNANFSSPSQLTNASAIGPNALVTASNTVQLGDSNTVVNAFGYSISNAKFQTFTLILTNTAGTIQHQIVADSVANSTVGIADKITGASVTLTNTPTVSNVVDFTNGVGVLSGSTHFVLLNTAAQTGGARGSATIEYDDTAIGALVRVCHFPAQNVNGVTRIRTTLIFTNSTTGAAFPITAANIPSGKSVYSRIALWIE